MKTRWSAVLAAGVMAIVLAGAAAAQEQIDNGSPSYFGGYSSFGGFYDTFGANGGHGGNSGYGTYRRLDAGSSSTTATTATFATIPLPGGAETSNHCTWLRGRAHATHQRKWRQRYAACLRDFSDK